jgi:hypothetical protein
MKKNIWVAACAALTLTSAYAQQQAYEPVVPRSLPESRVEPSGTLAPPVPTPQLPPVTVIEPPIPQLAMNVRRHQRDADARHCLRFASNREIHRCAERYRSHASRTRVTKAALKKPIAAEESKVVVSREKTVETTTTVVGPAKPVEVAKPLAKPSEAKPAAPVVPLAPTPSVAAKSAAPAPAQPSTTKPIEPAKTAK